MEKQEHRACFGGEQHVWRHRAKTLGCQMNVAVYLPPQQGPRPVLYWLSGLTCTEQNFTTKAGAQRYAAEHGLILVAPDTSPRGEDVPDDDTYDLGKGAGFYINATQSPWAQHYNMYDYIVDELPQLINAHFPTNGKASIFGHSMGGYGALMIALKNTERYQSVSAFSPIVLPTEVPWGIKAFTNYLGDDRQTWQSWDTKTLISNATTHLPMLITQGTNDSFLEEQLQTQKFAEHCAKAQYPITLEMVPDYDHSYYFIASFVGAHIAFHANHLA